MSEIKFGEEYWVAVISLLMYSILLITSTYQYIRHRDLDVHKAKATFNQCKLTFFAVLAVSSLASIPLWVACVARGGPDECEWNGPGYAFCWSLHLIALTGYSCCVGIPTIMWSDIVNGYSHKSFLKSFWDPNIDSTRVCFVLFAVSYILNEVLTVISMVIWMDPKDMSGYLEGNKVYGVGTFIEPIIICLFAGGCLLIGIRLQLYVRRVRLSAHTQRRLLWQLNTVLAVVTLSYLTRAAFIFNLRSHYNDRIFNCSYTVWIVCTHWFPHFLCSFCLLLLMSRAGPRGYCCCGTGGSAAGRGHHSQRQKGRRVGTGRGRSLISKDVINPGVSPCRRDLALSTSPSAASTSPLLGGWDERDEEWEDYEYEAHGGEEEYDGFDYGYGREDEYDYECDEWDEGLMGSDGCGSYSPSGIFSEGAEEGDNESSFRDSLRSYRTDYVDSEYDVNIALH